MGNRSARPSNRELFNALHERNRPETAITTQNFITGQALNLPRPLPAEVTVETIQMEASVDRSSFKLSKTPEGLHLLEFMFSSTIECSITVSMFAEEVLDARMITQCYRVDTEKFPMPLTHKFSRGVQQVFPAVELDLARYSDPQLMYMEKPRIPLVIEIVRAMKRPSYKDSRPVPFEATLLKFSKVFEGGWSVEPMKQKLTVAGRTLELFDLKGSLESSSSGRNSLKAREGL